MQKCESRTKRVMSAIIAGMMALQVVAPTISYADDTVASTASSEGNSDTQIDPGVPVQTDTASSNTVTEPDSSESLEETADSEQTGEIQDDTVSDSQGNETNTQEETVQDTVQQNNSGSETTESESVRTVTVTLNKNGGIFEPEWLETANEDPIAAYLGTETNDIAIEDTGDTIVATVTDRDSISIPVALSGDDSLYFTEWDVSSGSYDADNETLTFDDGVDAYVLTAVYNSVADEDQQLIENKEIFDEQAEKNVLQQKLSASGISLYEMRPSDSYNQLDLIIDGLAFTSDDGLVQTFTAPYDGDYTITAYGANGGTGKGKYQGYRTPGRGGKAEGTIHLNAGQTIHIYLGEAGGYWSTNRTFGGGGGQIDWDRAWFPDEDNGQTDRYHVFGRGGGATYVTVDAWTMDQAGEAAHDYTDAEKAQNDAAVEVAKKHVILLAGGGGGMGESGGTAGGGGLEGQGPVANRYYAGGFPPYSNAFSYDATVGGTTPTNGRVLTYDERVDAKVYPATQTRAGFGYHYTILGELYDANPANRDPVSLLFDDGQARNYGSFFYGANGITCSGAGGGGWFGGGTDYAFSGGGGSSFVNTSVTIDGKQVEVKDADYEVGGNMKYDSTNSAPYLINGRVLIHMVGTTPKMKTIMMEAQNEDISSSHVDDADVYGQKAYLNKGQDVASTTIAYTAITYYNMGDLMTVNPVWEYSTMLSPTDRDWNDSVAKSIDSRLSVSVANTNLGVPNPGDKYYNADYPGWYAVKSVMTITNPVNTMYSTERLTKYYFRCKGIASYTLSSGTKTMYDKGERGELAIDYNIYIHLNGSDGSSTEATLSNAKDWKYTFKHMPLFDANGNKITYTITEDAVAGYTYTVTNEGRSFTITNSHVQETFSIPVTKTWEDNGNQDGVRPSAIHVTLMGSDGNVYEANLTAAGKWKYEFKDLPRYWMEGVAIDYTLNEEAVNGYTYKIEGDADTGFTVTNEHISAVTNVVVNKYWEDAANQDGVRPDSVAVTLSGSDGKTYKATLTKDTGFSKTFENLPVFFNNGTKITYTVTEDAVNGYTGKITTDDTGYILSITNTHAPETIRKTVTKTWDDGNDRDGIRPTNVKIELYGTDGTRRTQYLTKDNHWSYSFENLPKYQNEGTIILYTIKEEAVDGYTQKSVTTTAGFDLTNTHEIQTADYEVKKVWIDDNDRDGARPTSITLTLTGSDGSKYTKLMTAADNWNAVTFERVPMFNGGKYITYTLTENEVPSYINSIEVSEDGKHFTVTNTHAPDHTVINITEVWHDKNDQDGIRPRKMIAVVVGSNGNRHEVPLHSSGDWHYTCDDLVKYWKNGQLVDYTVEAVTIDGYTSEVKSLGNNVFEVHNTHIPETISKTVTKTWKDNENQDGIRPASVTVTLTGSNAVSKTATLNEDNGWTATFENLPKRDHGNIVAYNVKESDTAGYEASVVKTEDGFQLINEHDSETTMRTVTLVWRDEDNRDGVRPDAVTYTLHGSDGSEQEKTVNKDDAWNDVVFEDLPVYQNGQRISYTLTESAIDDYTNDIRSSGNTFTVTNTHIPETVNVDVTKIWTDGENQDGNRPDSISVILTGSDGKRYTTTITAANNWKHTFLKLPKFFNEGTQIEYTLTEDTMSGYSDVVEKRSDYVFVLTNKYSPATVDVTIVKKWDDDNDRDGMRPESVDIVLNGSDGKLYTGTLSTENGYTCVFQSVPKYHDGGTLINYTIAEEKIPGYTTTIAKDASGYKFTLTNTKPIETVTKTVSKVWEDSNNQDGLRPSAITIILTGDDGSRRVKSVSAAENWTTMFENLPKNQNHGQSIQYTVSEAFVSGYTDRVAQNGDNYTITNTHTPAATELFVTKTWKDNGNNDGMRPDEITVTAHGSDGRSYTEKLNADNQWSVMFSNLPKYADGKVIEYSLTEESVPGYTSSITRNGKSFVLINTHVDETKNITITKAWNDGNNQDGLRPKTVTAVVNGSDGSARFVQLFEGQNWATNLNNLPKYKNGTEIQYTVKENAISGYETEIKQTGDSYAITNSHTPAVVTVSAVKVWDDANNQDGIRPSLIQVTLTGSDGSVRNAAITKNDGWTYQFKDLPQYKNGVKIDYTLQEANSNPYTYEIVKGSDEYSFTITNNYVPAVVNVPITTVWDDDDNRDGIRAKETAITLHGSNGKVYQRIVTGKDDFATVFEDVPKFFDEGREVVYTVAQNEMNGYTANIANTDKYTFQITNTHEPERLAKTVTKVWDDNNNQDGLRPNTLRIALTGTDGTYIEKSLSTANNWTEAFDGLYKYFKEGTPIQYTIDEEMVGGYEKEISEKDNLITITNTHAPEKLDLIVNVVWNDANNQDGYRPDAATIHMSGTDGTQDAKDFTKDSSWSSIVFKDLDHYKDGNEIKYTVAEDEIPQYTTSIAVNGNVVTVTNTHIPEITLRNISVVWEDNNDQDGLRPDTVSVKLKGNDKFIDSSELNEDVEWKHSFTKLPVRENGNEITYAAEENEIPGYTTSIEKTDTGYVFTNTHIPETVTVTVDKVWKDAENQDGLRPDAIHIRLISNDIEKDAYLDAESDWHLDFEGLPKYRDHGILNEYSVQEVDVDGYTSTVTTEDGYTFTIENDHVPAVIDIPITEEWIDDNDRDGLRPDSHTVVLVDGTNAIEEVVLDKNNGYGVVLKNMPKYKNGGEINYQIKDFKVDGYTTNIIKSDSVKDFNITNTHVPEMVTVTVTEGWHDQSDYDKIRPEKVTLTLTGSGGNVYEKTVTKDTWTTAFSDLPKNSKGEQIIYTLTQEGIKGYKTTITDNETGTIAVINTHEPVKTITVTVTWNDENNKDSIRPDKVTVKLTDGTTAVSTKEINNDSWKHVFENIIVFNGDGKASYTVTQDAVNGYTTEIKASDDGNTIEIINTHVPVAPPKEEPKQEETATPAAPAHVVEIKTEPTTTVIETPNKQTGISFMDGLFG